MRDSWLGRAALELIVGVNEETADRDDLVAVLETIDDLRVKLARDPRVNRARRVFAARKLEVYDAAVAFFDDRLVRHRKQRSSLGDDLHEMSCAVVRDRGGERSFNRRAAGSRRHSRDLRLDHLRSRVE